MGGFYRALPVILQHEGGYVDHLDDPGGRTNQGITQKTYDAFRAEQGQPDQSVRAMTDEERDLIYHTDYWMPAHCTEWPWPLDLAVFDAAVNHGPNRAIRLLQDVAGASVDGIVGPETRGKVGERDPYVLARAVCWERAELFAGIVRNKPSQAAFIVGWIRRLRSLIEHVDDRAEERAA